MNLIKLYRQAKNKAGFHIEGICNADFLNVCRNTAVSGPLDFQYVIVCNNSLLPENFFLDGF